MLLKTVHHFLSDLGYDTSRLPAHLNAELAYRIPSVGKKSTNRSTSVTLKHDGTYVYFDHATGAGGAFNPDWDKNKAPTPEEIENLRRKAEWVKQQEQLLKQKSYASKKTEAQKIWDKATPCDEHPYLQNNPKTAWIKPIGARHISHVNTTEKQYFANPLIIPLYDIDTNEIVSLQFITSTGKKRPLSGAQSTNYHFVIDGKLPSAFCEGYKTGLAFHHATGHRVVVCFNADMLKDVFKKLAKSDDFIIADNDNALDRNDDFTQKVIISELIIKGRGTGHKAALEVGSKFYMPSKPGADFADLTKDEIQEVLERPPVSSLPIYTTYQLPWLDMEKSGSHYLNMMSTEENPFQCACAARTFAKKSISSIPYQMSEWDLRETIERAANGNIHPATLENIVGEVRTSIAKSRKVTLSHLVVNKEILKRHHVQNIDRLDQVAFINRNRIPKRTPFTWVNPKNTVRAPCKVTPYYKGVYIVQAPTGSGKTQKIGLPFRKWCYSNRHTFLSVAHLRSLIREMSERLHTDHYEDEKQAVKQALKHGRFDQWNSSEDALSICLPSIDYEHFQDFIRRNRYVFIDEISQVLEAFTTDDMFHHTDTKLIYDRLCQIVAKAECLIVADANINKRTVEFLERCRPGEKFNFVQITPKDEGKTAFIHDTEAALFRHVLNRVMVDDHNVWITCDTASKVEELAKAFSHYDHINCLAITGPNQKKTEQTAFLNNPSEESKKYNIIIASSVISSGLSIEHDHFDFVAGFFTGSTIKPTDAYQMIGRVRPCKEFRLFLSQKHRVEVKAHRMLQGQQQASVLEDGRAAEVTEFSKMRVDLIETRFNAISNFANGLIYVLEQKCFEIKRCNVTLDEYESVIDHQANLKLIKEELSEEHQEALKAACPITDKMADDMKIRSYLDEQEMIELEAWHIKKALGYPCEHVLTDQDILVSPSQVIRFSATMGRYKASNDKQKDLTSRNYRKALSKIYSIIFDGVNLAPGAIFYKQCAATIIDRVYKYRFLLVSIGAIPRYFGAEHYKPSKTPAKELNDILKHMGLNAKRKRNSEKTVHMALYLYREKRSSVHLLELESESHYYQISTEQFELMQEYSDLKFNTENNHVPNNSVNQVELNIIDRLELDCSIQNGSNRNIKLQQVKIIQHSANDGPDEERSQIIYRIANE